MLYIHYLFLILPDTVNKPWDSNLKGSFPDSRACPLKPPYDTICEFSQTQISVLPKSHKIFFPILTSRKHVTLWFHILSSLSLFLLPIFTFWGHPLQACVYMCVLKWADISVRNIEWFLDYSFKCILVAVWDISHFSSFSIEFYPFRLLSVFTFSFVTQRPWKNPFISTVSSLKRCCHSTFISSRLQ